MKFPLLTIVLCVLTLGVVANAQNSIKLFDPVAISNSDPSVPWRWMDAVAFRTTEVYLNCPRNAEATLSGPNGGNLIVDNQLNMNGENVCPWGWNCFAGVFASPQIGQPVDNAYNGIAPLDVSDRLIGSGIYRFELMDYGYTLGASEIYLNTSCSLEAASQICHRNFGNKGNRTLSVPESAVAAHLAHGDTEGPCLDRN